MTDPHSSHGLVQWHGTTIVGVKKGGKTVIAGDGQVSMGNTVMKPNARKVRRIGDGSVIAGFAGATADAFTLFERLEKKLEAARGQLMRAAVELAKRLGAHVIATTGTPDKVERLKAASDADAVILAEGRFREQVAELTGGALCDLVYDPVGGDIFDESTRCVAFGGKLLVVGFAGGRIADISTNIPLIKGFSVVGVRAGEYARRFPDRGKAIREAVATLAADGRLNPHIDRVLPFTRWREAYEAMAARGIVGKIVLEP